MLAEDQAAQLVETLSSVLPVAGPVFLIAIQFSNASTALKIIQQKTTGKFSLVPFASLYLKCFIWTLYGVLKGDPTIFMPNGLGIAVAFFCMWAYHANSGAKPWNVYYGLLASTAAGLMLAHHQHEQVIGMLGCALSVLLSGSPLAVIRTVVKERSTAVLPFATSLVTWLNNLSWLCYGYVVADDVLIYGPNILGLALSSLQMSLFVVYGSNCRDRIRTRRAEGSGGKKVMINICRLFVAAGGDKREERTH